MKKRKILFLLVIAFWSLQAFSQNLGGNKGGDGWFDPFPTKMDSINFQVVHTTPIFAVVKVIEVNQPERWQVISSIETNNIPIMAEYLCAENGTKKALSYAAYQVGKALIEMYVGYTRQGITAGIPWRVQKEKVISTIILDVDEDALEIGNLLTKYQINGCMSYAVPEKYKEKKVVIQQ